MGWEHCHTERETANGGYMGDNFSDTNTENIAVNNTDGNTAGSSQKPAGSKRRRLTLAIIIAAAVVLLAGGICAYAFAGDYISNRFAMLTKSDTEYFKWYMRKRLDVASAGKDLALPYLEKNREPFDISEGLHTDISVAASVSPEFSKTFSIPVVRDAAVSVAIDAAKPQYGLEIAAKYSGTEVIRAGADADIDRKSVYVSVPSYKDTVIDISSLLEITDQNGNVTNLFDYIKEKAALAGEKPETLSTEEAVQLVLDCAYYLVDNTEDAKLEKGLLYERNGEKIKYNKLTVKYNGKQIFDYGKEFFRKVRDLEKESLSESANKLLELIEKAETEGQPGSWRVSEQITMYIKNNGQTFGAQLVTNINETVVDMELLNFGKGTGVDTVITVSINSVKAFDITINGTADPGQMNGGTAEGMKFNGTVKIVPGKLALAFIGAGSEASVTINCTDVSAQSGAFTITADCDNGLLDFLGFDSTQLDLSECELYFGYKNSGTGVSYKADLSRMGVSCASVSIETGISKPSPDRKKMADSEDIISADQLFNSDYFDLEALAKYIIGLSDTIADETFDSAIDALLQQLLGKNFTLSTIRSLMALTEITQTQPEEEPAEVGQEEENVSPYLQPERMTEYPLPEETYRYTHDYLADCAIPGQYRGLEYVKQTAEEITGSDFEEARDRYIADCEGLFFENVEGRGIENGDCVTFDAVLIFGGTPMTAYAYTDLCTVIGDYEFGDGLDDQFIGMYPGESRDVTFILNDVFGEAFAGMEETFRITVTGISEPVQPEWTEEFVTEYLGFDSLDACSDAIMDELTQMVNVPEDEIKADLTAEARALTTFAQPEPEVLLRLKSEYYYSLYDYTSAYGQTPEEYFVQYGGMTEEEFEEMLDETALEMAEEHSFYAAIAKAEDISLTGEELIDTVEKYKESYQCASYEELLAILPLESIIDYSIQDKIVNLIYANAVAVE